MSSSFQGTTWSNFYSAWQAPIRILEQIRYNLRDVVRLQLPAFLVARFVASKLSVHRARHDVADFDPVVSDFLHECFTKAIQAKLRSVVRGHLRVRICAR